MALTYNIETDIRYQQGIEKGKEAEKEEMIVAMLQSGLLTNEQIAQLADTSLKQISSLRKRAANSNKFVAIIPPALPLRPQSPESLW